MNHIKLLAQTSLGNISGIGDLGVPNRSSITDAFTYLETLISNVLAVLTVLGGLFFLFQIIQAGYNYISAGGDKALVQTAQKKITNNFLGLTIVVCAYIIMGLIGRFLGLDIIDLRTTLARIHP